MQELINAAEAENTTHEAARLLVTIEAANTTLVTDPPSLYIRRFEDDQGMPIEVPEEFDHLVACLFERFGAHYSFSEIWERAAQVSVQLRRGEFDSPASAAQEIIRQLNEPLDGILGLPQTCFVPVTGIGIASSLDLGTATYMAPHTAREYVRAWRRERNNITGLGNLPEIQEGIGGYLRVEVASATDRRRQELLQEKAEDAINLLRFYTRYLFGFDMFRNRPHLGGESPAVHVSSLYPMPHRTASNGLLYHFSLGMIPIGDSQIMAMQANGLADMVAWQDAPDGTARRAALLAAQRLGRAGSLYALEDRVISAFMAFDGWLTKDQRNFKKKNFAQRVAVLMQADPVSIGRMEAQAKDLYDVIRSELAHGGELRKRDTEWIDRITTNIGVMTMLHAIEIIKRHDGAWSLNDFWRELDALAAARPPS